MIVPLLAMIMAIGFLWGTGTGLLLYFKVWTHFEPDDRWLAWALLLGWPIISFAMIIELMLEARLDRKEARARNGG